ncbi:C-glycoside deglycosidase beta subunit domain-containing protein [Marinomonas sp.]|uniref:C-glycoside deglycosidase beta subunit domain-containing protein n=1 Tax=Marinomonas sp. TaxID=1904862 RepID=UPI003BA8CECA
MLERTIIQSRGCKNVTLPDGKPGFQFQIRNPNYRGVQASLVDGIDIKLDGRSYEFDSALWTLQGETYRLEQLRQSVDVRWQLDELATITLPIEQPVQCGVHDLFVCVFIRRPYIPAQFSRSPFKTSAKVVVVENDDLVSDIKLGVSTYSYSGDINTLMTLEDVMADIADIGASGLEMLSEGDIPGYPNVSSTWLDNWFRLLDQYKLQPTNLGTWVDTNMWLDRDLTVVEGAAQIQKDLQIASQLGFSSIRPKFGVTSLDLLPHPIWREAVERSLELANKLDIIICPEIHSPTPIKHIVTQGYIDFIEETKTDHFKLIIDTGIFQTAPCDDGHEGIELKPGQKRPPFLEPLKVPMADLEEILPHVHFIQSKFFEIDDQLNDLHVPWADIIKTLQANNWSGWLSSEYEGRREPYRGRDQIRRQHALLRSLLNQNNH